MQTYKRLSFHVTVVLAYSYRFFYSFLKFVCVNSDNGTIKDPVIDQLLFSRRSILL